MADHEWRGTPAPDADANSRRGPARAVRGPCSTCYGEGTVFHDYGPETCPIAAGLGELPSASVLSERRLRELERRYERRDEETWRDVRWLVGEVRGADHDAAEDPGGQPRGGRRRIRSRRRSASSPTTCSASTPPPARGPGARAVTWPLRRAAARPRPGAQPSKRRAGKRDQRPPARSTALRRPSPRGAAPPAPRAEARRAARLHAAAERRRRRRSERVRHAAARALPSDRRMRRRARRTAHEERRLLDLDLAAEAAELHDEHALGWQVAHAAIEGGAQARVRGSACPRASSGRRGAARARTGAAAAGPARPALSARALPRLRALGHAAVGPQPEHAAPGRSGSRAPRARRAAVLAAVDPLLVPAHAVLVVRARIVHAADLVRRRAEQLPAPPRSSAAPPAPRAHRSHSPPIMLMKSKVGIRSASMRALQHLGIGARLMKLGGRQRTLHGTAGAVGDDVEAELAVRPTRSRDTPRRPARAAPRSPT